VKSLLPFTLATAALLSGGPAAAQPSAKTPLRTQLDPGEVLCQRIVLVGSRLISKTVCMTRMQWQEQKSGDREYIEKVQSTLQLRDGG
jgi:hypothetical protein